ncbi:MAG: symmetrical bis(5'-nucleosyl)-tetraphosphatase [Nitrospirae bacterium]|nr:MAG: symmetrical bis(5'-nucleosyl)-tetraphosphatase [Nitrospirota bacterium]
MATYAIGDIQGCFSALQRLIEQFPFDPSRDRLWFVGDLVNRGPDSLSVLRYVKGLGEAAVTVLGNHDLHLLAVAAGVTQLGRKDTLYDVLEAPDRDALLLWLRRQPLLHAADGFVLVHAGLVPQWTAIQARQLAQEVETTLRSPHYREFLTYLYEVGYKENSGPRRWTESLTGHERLGVIANALTKLRVCSPEGDMGLSYKGSPQAAPQGFMPWFHVPNRQSAETTVVCGHWAALGLHIQDNLLLLDSGYVWGQQLTAVRLEDRQVFQISASETA